MEGHNVGHKRRRGPGEGSIYRRADGYWVGAAEAGRYTNGKRRKVRVVRKRKRDVVAALDELRRQVSGGIVPDRTHTVATYLGWWLDEVAARQVSASSLTEYAKRVRRVIPQVGHVRLAKLSPAHVQALANHLADRYPRSPKTRATTLETLRQALRWAAQTGMIARNPAEGITGPRTPIARVDDTLTAEEAHAVVAAGEGDAELGAMWWLALTYGMRLGELLDLRWSDITDDELTVRQAKTRAGVRSLPLIAEAKRVLRQHRRQQKVHAIDGYVFPTSVGTRRLPQRTREHWNVLLRRAGVEHRCRNCGSGDRCSSSVRRFHVSRHTAATLLLEAGVELEVTSAILGHASIGITADIYAKVRSDLKRRGLAKLDRGGG
jgi:integrase